MNDKTTNDRDTITIKWHITDVQEVRPDLTDDQARDVLWRVRDIHDANEGVNWYVIECVASEMFPEEEDKA
jgi:hypothetical protein